MTRRRPKRMEVSVEELTTILDRAASAPVPDSDLAKLRAAVDTLALVTSELERKGVSLERLRRMLFGPRTEKTSDVLGEAASESSQADDAKDGKKTGKSGKKGKKRKGHGRNGVDAYPQAPRVAVKHDSLSNRDRCPDCERGKVYLQSGPSVLVRVTGVAPLQASVYELDRLRCNLCGTVFTADAPEGVGTEKYDETAASMIGLMKYGCGLPFNRLERLERDLGIPLPAATQWDVVHRAAGLVEPAYAELVRQAGQGEVLHNDDTPMKILELTEEARAEALPEGADPQRTGAFTSGIVSMVEGRQIALFFTGPRHAGENLAAVLDHREADRPPPIHMSDGLSRNTPGQHETIEGDCTSHARRKYVDVASSFPEECRFVLETLREVYRNDAHTRKHALSAEERLRFHQAESGPLMGTMKEWLREQIEEHLVEPNSGLGEAICYMRKHWEELTLFLRVAGAPLDNNVAERTLKKAILHRKNALFYRTLNGARVGDIFMTLIHTAEANEVLAFDYLVALQRHTPAVLLDPAAWMPWNYTEALERLTLPHSAPPD